MVNRSPFPQLFDHPKWAGLSHYARCILLYLDRRRNGKTGRCNPSHARIQQDIQIGRTTLLLALTELTAKGLIRRHPGHGRGHSSEYEIVPPDNIIKEGEIVSPRDTIINRNSENSVATRTEIVPPRGTLTRYEHDNTVCKPSSLADATMMEHTGDRHSGRVFNSPAYRLAFCLWEDIAKQGTAAKKPDMQKWAAVFDTIHRLDGRPWHWIKKTMLAARERDQWLRDNMKNPHSLRRWLNAGRLDKYTPTEWLTDEEVLASLGAEGKAA